MLINAILWRRKSPANTPTSKAIWPFECILNWSEDVDVDAIWLHATALVVLGKWNAPCVLVMWGMTSKKALESVSNPSSLGFCFIQIETFRRLLGCMLYRPDLNWVCLSPFWVLVYAGPRVVGYFSGPSSVILECVSWRSILCSVFPRWSPAAGTTFVD